MPHILYLLILMLFGYAAPVFAQRTSIVINEIMPANVDVYRDPSTNFGSWVELYNPSAKSVKLGGLYVTDTPDNLRKHRLVDDYGTLPAHGFAILNFGHHEVWTPTAYRQIKDKLDCDGGTIIISDGDQILASQTYPKAISRTSYARTTDGGDTWGVTANPTPSKSNAKSRFATLQLDAPEVEPKGHLFASPFTAHVTIPKGATLRYTTDGSTPTDKSGKVSKTGNFAVDATAIYRFRLYRDGWLPSPVTTCTYIFKDRAYPLPIVSVVSDEANFTSPKYGVRTQGINGRPGNGYTEPANWNMDWDRPVNFEYITTDNQCVVNQECDYAVSGAWSRRPVCWTPMGGISFKLKASKVYDRHKAFKYPFFEDKPNNRHKAIFVRQGGTHPKEGFVDSFVREVVHRSGIDLDMQGCQSVHHFINGIYKGVVNLREPSNYKYAYANYGYDTDSIEQFEVNTDSGYIQVRGSDEAFQRWCKLSETASEDSSYAKICDLVDIDAYVNYMAVRLYLGGTDWPHNNIKGFRYANGGRFRFVLFDQDIIGNSNAPLARFFAEPLHEYNILCGTNHATGECLDGTRYRKENPLIAIFGYMLKNASFRKRFIDTFLIVAGSVFEPKRVKAIISEKATILEDAMQGMEGNDPWTSVNVVMSVITGRENKMAMHLQKNSKLPVKSEDMCAVTLDRNNEQARLLLNGIEVPYAYLDGHVNLPATIEAIAPEGYRFVGWQRETGRMATTEAKLSLPPMPSKRVYTAIYEPINGDGAAPPATPVPINR